MSSKRRPALILGLTAALSLGAVALALGGDDRPAPPGARSERERPTLLLLSSLPIVFGETFALDGGGSAALTRLEEHYRVVPIAVADRGSLERAALLFAAQPRAQPAEALVDLDAWVRAGGRLLLLADPALEWRSERSLGDPLRPPPMFADTGLLRHWGLRLDAPDDRGPVSRKVEDRDVRTASAGVLTARGKQCVTAARGFVARCALGKGYATIVADADFLNIAELEGAGQGGNLDLLVDELAALEAR